ncbi:MAG: hypothetical protein ORO03_05245 [Alphaproteobacteria bacterium]|nr:hypothetical protein [Alphaproteobacteria bacterium]
MALMVWLGCSRVWAGEALPEPDRRAPLILYTAFAGERLKPLIAEIKASLKIEVTVIQVDKDNLLTRLLPNDLQPVPDLVLVPEVGRLERLAASGLIRPLHGADMPPEVANDLRVASERIPPQWQIAHKKWLTVAKFSQVIVVSRYRPQTRNLSRTVELGSKDFAERICPTTQVTSPSFRLLVTNILKQNGHEATRNWLEQVVKNMVVEGSNQAEGVKKDGLEEERILQQFLLRQCDIALVSSRALARRLEAETGNSASLLDQSRMIWADGFTLGATSAKEPSPAKKTKASDLGVTMDGIGLALTSQSTHSREAAEVANFLLGETGQRLLAAALWSYPIIEGVPLSNPVARLGPFTPADTELDRLIPLFDEAAAIANMVAEKQE